MHKFFGRVQELQVLERAYESHAGAFVPIYGRRRVGKSELILHFLRKHSGLYFLGKKAAPAVQFREFTTEAARVTGEPLLKAVPPSDWKTALALAVERWPGPGKLVLVFDEFQWTVEACSELPSVLQDLWDRSWRDSGRVVLILCGSYVGFMEREVLGRKSPLFGRRTAQILLRPFNYRESAEFHASYSRVDQARAYYVCGGIPLYLNMFSTDRSLEENIADNLLNEFAPLFREPDFLLREELREVESYYSILLSIASGSATNKDISSATGISVPALHYYLKHLVELGYLKPRHPLTERPPVARYVRYAIDDPLLRFWFRFVYPNTSFILSAGARAAMADRVRPELESYFGSCFERLCREALPLLYRQEGVTANHEIGEYWSRDTQIDVVGLRDDGWTDLGECKWGPVRSPKQTRQELEDRVALYPNERMATIGRRIFTRHRITERHKTSGTRWHCLDDLYDVPA